MEDFEFLKVLGLDNAGASFDIDSMIVLMKKIVALTIDELSFSGMENLDPAEHYLYISDHRDIFLDPALLQLLLVTHGFRQTHILAGKNLMCHPLMIAVSRANKVFCIERGDGGKRAFYESMSKVSAKIHDVASAGESVWIAQRNGRTKDGVDATDPALMKMLAIAGEGSWKERVVGLNIVPLSISYEWEPCDLLKARELYLRAQGPYVKAEGEDMHSIVEGIRQKKGRVHYSFGKPLRPEEVVDPHQLAQLLDERIAEGYRLWPNTFVARDMAMGGTDNKNHYTAAQREAFERHLEEAQPEYRDNLLKIYQNNNVKL